ncbi:DUF742 domain-containing protein [Streptomyces sp. DT224]|uniref:DUF742 domain-containing protein n=1 Tax=Streptomyces sp. DT224 TaxID=3393426 RepID=UPI003CECD1B2
MTEDSREEYVRAYALTGGRTLPRHVLALETVVVVGPGRPGPAHGHEYEEILALCRERRRSVAELAGVLARPVTVVKILVSDLLDGEALTLPLTTPYDAAGSEAGPPSTQLLVALAAGLKRRWPDADTYRRAG